MKTSAWLVLEVRRRYNRDTLHIKGVRQTRPSNELAVEVILDVDDSVLYPKVEALVVAGHLQLDLLEEE